MYIRDMHLNHRRSDRTDSILQSDGRMGVSTRIQNDAVHIKTYLLNLVYQLSLNVGLEIVNLYIRIFLAEFGKVVFKSNATKRFILGPLIICILITQFFIPLRCKDSANRKQMQIYLQFAEMQPIFAKQR